MQDSHSAIEVVLFYQLSSIIFIDTEFNHNLAIQKQFDTKNKTKKFKIEFIKKPDMQMC